MKCGERFPTLVGSKRKKESVPKARQVPDAEARRIEREQAQRLPPERRGQRSTLQGRICGRLETLGEADLQTLIDELVADDPEEIKHALGLLFREGAVRPHRVGPHLRYRLSV